MHSYDTDQVAKWGVVSWMVNEGDAPLVDMVFNASSDMVDYNLSIIFESQDSSNNYLRIQVLHSPKESVQYTDVQTRVAVFKKLSIFLWSRTFDIDNNFQNFLHSLYIWY